jgi:hypothetical protein
MLTLSPSIASPLLLATQWITSISGLVTVILLFLEYKPRLMPKSIGRHAKLIALLTGAIAFAGGLMISQFTSIISSDRRVVLSEKDREAIFQKEFGFIQIEIDGTDREANLLRRSMAKALEGTLLKVQLPAEFGAPNGATLDPGVHLHQTDAFGSLQLAQRVGRMLDANHIQYDYGPVTPFERYLIQSWQRPDVLIVIGPKPYY